MMEERERGETIEDFSKRLDEVPGELEKNLDFSLMLYVLGSSGMGDHVDGALGRVGAR